MLLVRPAYRSRHLEIKKNGILLTTRKCVHGVIQENEVDQASVLHAAFSWCNCAPTARLSKKQHFNVRLKYKNKTQNSLTEEH